MGIIPHASFHRKVPIFGASFILQSKSQRVLGFIIPLPDEDIILCAKFEVNFPPVGSQDRLSSCAFSATVEMVLISSCKLLKSKERQLRIPEGLICGVCS